MEETPPAPTSKTSPGKIVAFVGCGCLGLIALIVAGVAILFFGLMGALKSSAPYEDTVALVQSHPEAIAALGEPIKAGMWLTGNISINNGEGEASFSVPVSGPDGSGTLFIEAEKRAGSKTWDYSRRELQIEGDDDRTILLSP